MHQLSQSSGSKSGFSQLAAQDAASHERLLDRAADLFWTWRERHRGRANLAGMPEAALKDIGLSRGDAEQEWEKPFWRR